MTKPVAISARIKKGLSGWFRFPWGQVQTGTIPNIQVPYTLACDPLQLALGSNTVWACARLISQAIAALPAAVYEATANGKRKATEHPLYWILSKQPNPHLTRYQWIQSTVVHLMIYGNAFTMPVYVNGEIAYLDLLDPARMRIVWRYGNYAYEYLPWGGTRSLQLMPDQFLHFRLFSLDGTLGLSPLDYQRMVLDNESSSMSYATSIYKNGGRPSGVLEYPGNLKAPAIQAIRDSWNQIHGGPDGVGRVAILDGGTKYNPISVPLQQLEYIASQKLTAEQIARVFGVPPHLIGAQDKTPYASVEQQTLEFSQYTLQPIVTSLEATIGQALLPQPYSMKFNLSAFERADIATRYRAYAMGRQWGWFSVNDIRELEELNHIEGGDTYLQPLNMVPADSTAALGENISTKPSGVPGGVPL